MKKNITLAIGLFLALSPSLWAIEELEKIVVSATKTAQKVDETTSDIKVITAEELQSKQVTNLTQALNLLGGVNFTSSGGLGQQGTTYIRGMDRGVLLMIDGVRINDMSSIKNLASFEHILVQDIEQIEVIKGIQSGIWGADASSGVINVITKKASKKGFSGSASISHGSNDTTNGNIALDYKASNAYVSINTQVAQTEGLSAMSEYGKNPKAYEKDGYENHTTTLKAGFAMDATNKVDMNIRQSKSTTQIDGLDPITWANNPNHVEETKAKSLLKSLNFNHIDSFNEVNIYGSDSEIKREYPTSAYQKEFKSDIREYGFNSKIPYNGSDFILWGVDYKKSSDKIANEDFNNRGYFLTNNNHIENFLGANTTLTESIRRDEHNKFEDKTTFKVGMKRKCNLVEGLSSSVNYGTAYNTPSLYNLYAPYGMGNENLTPEKVKGFDASLTYKDIKITYFDTKIENMIDYDMALWKYNNIAGTSNIKGYEVELHSNIAKDTSLLLNYTNLNAKDKEGKKLARRADKNFKFGVDYYGIDKLHVGAFGEYIGERYDRANQSGRQTGKYTTLNLVADYSVNEDYTLFGKVENIGDKYYQSVDGFSSDGRTFSAGMRVDF